MSPELLTIRNDIASALKKNLDGKVPTVDFDALEKPDRDLIAKAKSSSEEAAKYLDALAFHRALDAIWELDLDRGTRHLRYSTLQPVEPLEGGGFEPAALRGLDFATVVPGHGPVYRDKARLDAELRFFRDLVGFRLTWLIRAFVLGHRVLILRVLRLRVLRLSLLLRHGLERQRDGRVVSGVQAHHALGDERPKVVVLGFLLQLEVVEASGVARGDFRFQSM